MKLLINKKKKKMKIMKSKIIKYLVDFVRKFV